MQDRQTAIVVDEHVVAPVIPIDVDIAGVVGAPQTHWHAELTDDKFLAPGLAATVLGSVIEATTSERRDLTWKLTSHVTDRGPRDGGPRRRRHRQRRRRRTPRTGRVRSW